MAEEMNMGEVVMVVDDNKEIVYSISERRIPGDSGV